MEKIKSIFTKFLITSMIIAIFSTSLLQTTASANTDNLEITDIEEQTEVIADIEEQAEVIADIEQSDVETYALPPRQPSKDPFWKWVSATLAIFVGASLAQTITQNAINNGIDYACEKWDNVWGVRQACKIIQN